MGAADWFSCFDTAFCSHRIKNRKESLRFPLGSNDNPISKANKGIFRHPNSYISKPSLCHETTKHVDHRCWKKCLEASLGRSICPSHSFPASDGVCEHMYCYGYFNLDPDKTDYDVCYNHQHVRRSIGFLCCDCTLHAILHQSRLSGFHALDLAYKNCNWLHLLFLLLAGFPPMRGGFDLSGTHVYGSTGANTCVNLANLTGI